MNGSHWAIALALLSLPGCAGIADDLPPATQPSLTAMPAEQGTAAYWLNKPAIASVSSADFFMLWKACRDTLQNDDFDIDRQDYRLGLLTTWPMVSKQLAEFWRSDAGTFHAALLSTLQTVRRTVQFEITRTPEGLYVARPKVLVEQATHEERHITSVAEYSAALTPLNAAPTRLNQAGEVIPSSYWYALGRDEAMERELVNSVREKLRDP